MSAKQHRPTPVSANAPSRVEERIWWGPSVTWAFDGAELDGLPTIKDGDLFLNRVRVGRVLSVHQISMSTTVKYLQVEDDDAR